MRTRFGLRAGLRTLPPLEAGLPALPRLGLALHRLEEKGGAACDLLAADLRASVAA